VTRGRDLDIFTPRLVQEPRPRVLSHFTVDGDPGSKQRPKFARRGSKTITYTPDKTVAAEEMVRWAYKMAGGRKNPDPAARYGLSLVLLQKGYARRDIDNMQKLIQDALNEWSWADDWQIDEVIAQRRMGAGAGALAEVLIYLLEEERMDTN
jgi:Holliday junction resolvase RusA-like endonuclease